ncbi:MAG: efflux RND transporter periplasmic adaptor subunit [Pelomonas sp.]|nr:efflux RND transporter periplasmic adaptor subunit [Roseateles sp.]
MLRQDPASSAVPRSTRSRQQGKAWVWGLGVVALLIAGGWWHHAHKAAADAASAQGGAPGSQGGPGGGAARRFAAGNRAQPVSVETTQRRDMHVNVEAIGTLAANNTATVHVQVSGVLQDLLFKEGQPVRKGQALAHIDPRAFAAALAQAEGVLLRDRAQLDNARVDLKRYQDLVAKDAVPRQQLDTQVALVQQLVGTVRSDQGAVDTARLQLGYCNVVAPISGRAGLKQVDLGNVVSPSDANGVVVIAETQPIALTFSVPSANLPKIAAAMNARQTLVVEAWGRDGKHKLAEGRVASRDNAIDPTTDTIKLKALFDNRDESLYPNQAVRVRLQLDTLPQQLAVPTAAVQRGADGFYVYVVGADQSVSARKVVPGVVDGDWTGIDGSVQPGESVVIDGIDRLRDGAKVEVIAKDPNQRAGAQPTQHRGRHGAGAASGAASGAAGGWGHRASAASGASN